MNRSIQLYVVTVIVLLAAVAWAADGFMSVQVREGQVRQAPAFLSPVTTTLAYGDRVSLLGTSDVWTHISAPTGAQGWMHTSALTTKEVVLEATAADVQAAASGKEIALAGKGFNKQVEDEYRAENQDLDYTLVDEMESRRTSQAEIERFLSEGDVRQGGGQ